MKRLISIFVVAILIAALLPFSNVFANSESDYENLIELHDVYYSTDLDSALNLNADNFKVGDRIYFDDLEKQQSLYLYIPFEYMVYNSALISFEYNLAYFSDPGHISFVTSNNDLIDTQTVVRRENNIILVNEDNQAVKGMLYVTKKNSDVRGFIEIINLLYDPEYPLPESYKIPKDVKNINYEVTTDTATFNYDLPSDEDFSHVNVYFNNEVYQTTDTTFILENLSPNTDYVITFQTVNTEGIESLGITVNFKTDDLPPPPPLEETDIHNLKAEVSADRVDLTWNNPKTDKFEKAIIYRATLTSNQQTSFLDYFKPLKVHADELKPIFETNGTTFADLTIQPEQQYQYKVTAMIDGTETEGATVTTDPIPKPPPFDFKEVELPFTASNIIKSAFEFIGFFGAFILLALAIRLTPRLVKLIRRSSVNRSRAR